MQSAIWIELGHTAHKGGAHGTSAVQVYIIYCIALRVILHFRNKMTIVSEFQMTLEWEECQHKPRSTNIS